MTSYCEWAIVSGDICSPLIARPWRWINGWTDSEVQSLGLFLRSSIVSPGNDCAGDDVENNKRGYERALQSTSVLALTDGLHVLNAFGYIIQGRKIATQTIHLAIYSYIRTFSLL
jgi:hypothetical protein